MDEKDHSRLCPPYGHMKDKGGSEGDRGVEEGGRASQGTVKEIRACQKALGKRNLQRPVEPFGDKTF